MIGKHEAPSDARARPDGRQLSGKPLSQILADLRLPNKHARVSALELLTVHLADLMGLDPRAWLVKGADSGGVEVGIIADHKNMPFSRWQIQCRNSKRVDMGEIAAAIGRGMFLKPNVVLSVTTGSFTSQARSYATRTAELTNLQILLMEADDLDAIAQDEKSVEGILRRETGRVEVGKQLLLERSGGGTATRVIRDC